MPGRGYQHLRQISMEFDLPSLRSRNTNKGKARWWYQQDFRQVRAWQEEQTELRWTKSKRTDTRANLSPFPQPWYWSLWICSLDLTKQSCCQQAHPWRICCQWKGAVLSIAIANFVKAEKHTIGRTATELLTNLQAREPILLVTVPLCLQRYLKAKSKDLLREIYGVSYVSAFHNKKNG